MEDILNSIRNSGFIIAIEGIDCSFKETNFEVAKTSLTKILSENETDYRLHSEHFPRYDKPASTMINKWLNGELDREWLMYNPSVVNSFYCIDKHDYWYSIGEEGITELSNYRNRKDIFLFDRYTFSNSIYNSFYKDRVSYADITFDSLNYGIPYPNMIIWMRMRDFDMVAEMLSKKKNKDHNELDLSYIKEVWDRSEAFFEFVKNNNSVTMSTYKFACGNVDTKFHIIELLDDEGHIKSRDQLAKEIKIAIGTGLTIAYQDPFFAKLYE